MAFSTSRDSVAATINMTPVIDVLLVLLIIFLAIAPTHPKGLPASVPQSASAAAAPEQTLVLEVRRDGQLLLNQHPLVIEKLSEELRSVLERRADRTLFVRGDRDLDFSSVVHAIDLAKDAGAEPIGLLTHR